MIKSSKNSTISTISCLLLEYISSLRDPQLKTAYHSTQPSLNLLLIMRLPNCFCTGIGSLIFSSFLPTRLKLFFLMNSMKLSIETKKSSLKFPNSTTGWNLWKLTSLFNHPYHRSNTPMIWLTKFKTTKISKFTTILNLKNVYVVD